MLNMLRYLEPRAIGLGVLANLILSFCLSFLVSLLLAIILTARGLSQSDIEALLRNPWHSMGIAMLLLIAGALSDYGAGLVTARFARQLEYYQTLAMMVFMWLVGFAVGSDQVPQAYSMLSLLCGLGASLYGAYRVKQMKRQGGR